MTIGILTASYITSSVLFILALGGLSNQEKAKRAVWYGIVGMMIAVVATIFGNQVFLTEWLHWLIGAILIGSIIGAISGPAVAGGMELALWCDFRVMEKSSYLGVYCRRWGIPLIDGGTVRLPKIVGQGRALEITLTGRKVMSDECLNIGLCEYVVEDGYSRNKAEEIAKTIAKFPQECVRADRHSTLKQFNLNIKEGLLYEWNNSMNNEILSKEGIKGAIRFSKGHGRHGNFQDI